MQCLIRAVDLVPSQMRLKVFMRYRAITPLALDPLHFLVDDTPDFLEFLIVYN